MGDGKILLRGEQNPNPLAKLDSPIISKEMTMYCVSLATCSIVTQVRHTIFERAQ